MCSRQSREVVTDATRLLTRYGFTEALELVEQKQRGEKSELPQALSDRWAAKVPDAFALLERAHAESRLPDAPVNEDALEQWLVQRRLAG